MFLMLRSCPLGISNCSDVRTLVSDWGTRVLHVGIQIGGGTIFFVVLHHWVYIQTAATLPFLLFHLSSQVQQLANKQPPPRGSRHS